MGQWESFSDFIAMGGYARYVWVAYAMVLICFVGELYSLGRRRQRAARELFLEARAHMAEEDI